MGADMHPAESPAEPVLEVAHRADGRFYELLADGQFAGLIVYGAAGRRYIFTHTFIAEGYRGRGLSQVMLRGVLDDLKARHITVTNYCPVLNRFLEQNPEYIALIDPGRPGTWPRSPRDTAAATHA